MQRHLTEQAGCLVYRNLVSALLHHEQIQTTLPKAKEAARMAEKVIAAQHWAGIARELTRNWMFVIRSSR